MSRGNKMDEEKFECKRCESGCVIISHVDDEGNSWDESVLDGQLCSCSKWTKINIYKDRSRGRK
jgi:hypothetical protein